MHSYRALVEKLEAIQRGDTLVEAIKLKDVIAQIAGTEQDDKARFAKLAQIATANQLPGLYDPVSGQFISTDGSASSTADKEVDKKLAYLGLIPQGAGTSTWLGKTFGTTGDKYDADLRSQSGAAISDQDLEEKQLAQLKDLAGMITKFQTMKTKGAPAATPAATPAPATVAANAISAATPKPGELGSGTFGMNEGSMFASSLIESFGYKTEGVTASDASTLGQVASSVAAKTGAATMGKMASKIVPFAGAAFGAYDAYDRAKKGDYVGAGLAGLSGALSLIPGVGWIPALGLDMVNVGRDLSGASARPGTAPAGQGAKAGPKDPKVAHIQNKILAIDPNALPKFGADGRMGAETRAAMQKYNVVGESLAQSIASLRDRLAIIETAEDGGEQFTADTGTEQPMMFQKDGKNYALIKGKDGEPDQLVDQEGNLIDGSKPELPVIGKATISESLNENWLTSLFSKFATGAAKAGKTFAQGVKSPMATPLPNAGLAKNVKFKGPSTAFKAGQAAGRNPLKTAAGVAAAGLAGGAAMGMGGSDSSTAPIGQGAKISAGGANNAAADKTAADAKAAEDKALAELKAQIEASIKDLSTTAKSSEVKNGLAPLVDQWTKASV